MSVSVFAREWVCVCAISAFQISIHIHFGADPKNISTCTNWFVIVIVCVHNRHFFWILLFLLPDDTPTNQPYIHTISFFVWLVLWISKIHKQQIRFCSGFWPIDGKFSRVVSCVFVCVCIGKTNGSIFMCTFLFFVWLFICLFCLVANVSFKISNSSSNSFLYAV